MDTSEAFVVTFWEVLGMCLGHVQEIFRDFARENRKMSELYHCYIILLEQIDTVE